MSSDGSTGLRREIGLRNAIALYVGSVLGSGVLVLPGLAAQLAGPASLIAWAMLAVASLPFALTFATLSARRPESGGVYAFAREAFGGTLAAPTAWLFALWSMVGAPAVALIAAAYLGYAFPIDRPEAFALGFGIVAAAFAVNVRGIRLSNAVQIAIVLAIAGLLVVTIALAGVRVRAGQFQPFAPYGAIPIGTAAALIFWSFLGYENVSNVAEEFVDPRRDFRRAVYASVAIVGLLYFAVAFVTVGTGADQAGGGVAPFAAILGSVFGPYGAAGTAILAVVIIFCVVNAYSTGMSRVVYAAAGDGAFPRRLHTIDAETGVPRAALTTLFLGGAGVFVVYYLFDVDLTLALLVASGAAIAVYAIGSAAAIRIHGPTGTSDRRARAIAVVSLALSLAVAPFLGWPVLVAVTVLAIGAVVRWIPRSRGNAPA